MRKDTDYGAQITRRKTATLTRLLNQVLRSADETFSFVNECCCGLKLSLKTRVAIELTVKPYSAQPAHPENNIKAPTRWPTQMAWVETLPMAPPILL